MLKIGRNDPCHCGSGKKYKKCCADTDAEKLRALTPDTQLNEVAKAFLYDIVHNQNEEYLSSDYGSKVEDEDDDPYPSISTEEEKLVDDWWDVYRKIDSIEEIRSHLEDFTDKHPHLVENLGLEHEVLFELGAEYRRQERTGEYIAFLMDFRKRFPATYVRSAGYYDADIIAWLISKGGASEIKHYLNYFIEKPVTFADQLYAVIDLLLATGNTEEVIPLILLVAKPIVESDEIIYGGDIVHPLLIDALCPYIKTPFTEGDVQKFVEDLKEKIPFKIDMDENIVEVWSKKLQAITKPIDRWPETVPSMPLAQKKLCSEIRFNFMGYLQETLNISWMSAQYYADLIYEYLATHLERTKGKNKHLFDLSRKNVENLLAHLTREMYIYVDCTKFMGLLNAVHFFAAYLHRCNNFTTEEMEIVQRDCKNIYSEFYPELKKEYTEALCFAEFPVRIVQ